MYFLSRTLISVELKYMLVENTFLALLYEVKLLKTYFEG